MKCKTLEHRPRGPDRPALTRRELLKGAAAAALAASAPSVFAAPARKQRGATAKTVRTSMPLRRYMAASAVLGDGRILVTGGYGMPGSEGSMPSALNSAVILDPASGLWTVAAPMAVPRARHAAVSLDDGRVAVLGGIGMNPTASVEIYDPKTNSWRAAAPLAQPRYDHCAVSDGNSIYVLGGTSQAMLSSVEVFELRGASRLPRRP